MAKTFGHRTEVFVICACQQQIPHQLKADKQPSLPPCSGSCQKSKLDRSHIGKKLGEFKKNLRHMVTVERIVIIHCLTRKCYFSIFYVLFLPCQCLLLKFRGQMWPLLAAGWRFF